MLESESKYSIYLLSFWGESITANLEMKKINITNKSQHIEGGNNGTVHFNIFAAATCL